MDRSWNSSDHTLLNGAALWNSKKMYYFNASCYVTKYVTKMILLFIKRMQKFFPWKFQDKGVAKFKFAAMRLVTKLFPVKHDVLV